MGLQSSTIKDNGIWEPSAQRGKWQRKYKRSGSPLPGLADLRLTRGAYGIIVVYAALWFAVDRDSLDWHAVATLAVWFMTLLIQRTEHRDTQALKAQRGIVRRVGSQPFGHCRARTYLSGGHR
jgi:hypothetical protein